MSLEHPKKARRAQHERRPRVEREHDAAGEDAVRGCGRAVARAVRTELECFEEGSSSSASGACMREQSRLHGRGARLETRRREEGWSRRGAETVVSVAKARPGAAFGHRGRPARAAPDGRSPQTASCGTALVSCRGRTRTISVTAARTRRARASASSRRAAHGVENSPPRQNEARSPLAPPRTRRRRSRAVSADPAISRSAVTVRETAADDAQVGRVSTIERRRFTTMGWNRFRRAIAEREGCMIAEVH